MMLLGLAVMLQADGATAPETAPYPPGPVIREVVWDFNGLIRVAPGSDLWPATWGRDGHVYTSWGDGGGFGKAGSLFWNFPTKWMSPDGKTLWCVFSSTGVLDSFNLVKATLSMR